MDIYLFSALFILRIELLNLSTLPTHHQSTFLPSFLPPIPYLQHLNNDDHETHLQTKHGIEIRLCDRYHKNYKNMYPEPSNPPAKSENATYDFLKS